MELVFWLVWFCFGWLVGWFGLRWLDSWLVGWFGLVGS
jgi:hypothetical protein